MVRISKIPSINWLVPAGLLVLQKVNTKKRFGFGFVQVELHSFDLEASSEELVKTISGRGIRKGRTDIRKTCDMHEIQTKNTKNPKISLLNQKKYVHIYIYIYTHCMYIYI